MGGGLAHSRLYFRDWLNSYLQVLISCLCNLALPTLPESTSPLRWPMECQ